MAPIDPRKLLVFVEGVSGRPSVGPVPLPTPADVLYEPPLVQLRASTQRSARAALPLGTATRTTGSQGKRCDNCRLWAERETRCCILGREVVVPAGAVCGYHVVGEPQLYVTALSGDPHLTPELAGFVGPESIPPRGTTCDSCVYYDAMSNDDGCCRAVADPDTGLLARVQALGCCARWRAKPEPTLPHVPPTL